MSKEMKWTAADSGSLTKTARSHNAFAALGSEREGKEW
jgi:hypothetical protein